MNPNFSTHLDQTLNEIREQGLYKDERIIASPQDTDITLTSGQRVINFCANNYLGLSNHPTLVNYASNHIKECGYGMSSVRFICGTQRAHRELEIKLAEFLGTEDCILFPSCFDANAGVFEALLTAEDAIISDQLNHASIIDGIRLCKAKRFRYANNDMADLEQQLKAADEAGARFKMVVSDGVFSMDGIIANLAEVCRLAEQYQAIVLVDDSHATGFTGENGKGTHEHTGTLGKVDILTGTLGKGLGGASGGYVAGPKNVVAMLKNKARPYLFSNAVAPVIAATSIKALELIEQEGDAMRAQLRANAKQFRQGLEAVGFDLIPGEHPIIPVMIYDEKKAAEMASELLKHDIYVIAFSFPVVPKGLARIRTQMSAAHTPEQIEKAIEAFTEVGQKMGLLNTITAH